MATFTLSASSLTPKTLITNTLKPSNLPTPNPNISFSKPTWSPLRRTVESRKPLRVVTASVSSDYSSKRSSSSSNEPRETIMLPGCDYNHWLIVMEFPKDPAPTREQMIDTYLNTLETVLGSVEEARKNMYAFSTTTYTGFQCTVDEATSEKFKGLPGVLWVLPDSYIDVKNKDYGGDKYINGEIIPCQYPTYQPKQQRNNSKYVSKRYERRRDGPPVEPKKPRQVTPTTDSTATS